MPEETRRTTHRLDPRSPLVLDTRELGRRPGSMRSLSRSVPAPAHLGLDVLGVPEGSTLELDLRLESVVEGVLVSGTVAATVSGECVRCLDPVSRDVVVDLQELYARPGRGQEAHVEAGGGSGGETDDLPQLAGDLLDIEPALRDAVVLALPFQPLCRDDCPGLCPECGARLADDPEHRHETVDPRWAELRRLTE
ncbi:MAG TPA: YceD family protein [Actinomycetes bacterium]